jgi:16S rRNA (adenine1518-N6/adenine1519-N6)-dimethyltransferase
MVQKEVGERITALPPKLSILGVAARLDTEPRIAFVVPPDVFYPPPAVESAVLILDVHDRVPIAGEERETFFRIVTAGFQQRRKQLANSLADTLALPKPEVMAWLAGSGIAADRRAQTLTVEEWLRLAAGRPPAIGSRR